LFIHGKSNSRNETMITHFMYNNNLKRNNFVNVNIRYLYTYIMIFILERSVSSSFILIKSKLRTIPVLVLPIQGDSYYCYNNHFDRQQRQRQRHGTISTTTLFAYDDEIDYERKRMYNSRYELLQHSSKLSLAPMMDYTDRHFRHLIRCISKHTLLYTEMVAANAICHEQQRTIHEQHQQQQQHLETTSAVQDEFHQINYEKSHLLRYLRQGDVEPLEGASVLQLGGSDPQQMYDAARVIMELTKQGYSNYTAINLNCGCPSPKVAGKGCFGAALMDEPQLVAQITKAIYDGCDGTVPVTVKCRIGTDSIDNPFHRPTYDLDSNAEQEYEKLCHFIETVASNQVVSDFAVHARIAVIHKSFSPADNRKIPPLKYDTIRRLVQDFPHLQFTLNGGINTLAEVQYELQQSPNLQGIMIGRAFAADPWSFAMADQLVYNDISSTINPKRNRFEILKEYGRHADAEEERGDVHNIRRFILKAVTPLFSGEMNAKKYRIALDEIARIPKQLKLQGKTLCSQPPISELIMNAAMTHLSEETLLRSPEESYERIIYDERMRIANNGCSRTSRSLSIDEWQELRKQDEIEHPSSYEQVIANGVG
jgi:tRNA-dihydrouridine synthase A